MIPAVSVILASYNARAFLEPTVHSVYAQTFPDWELIIVDDGSTDGTLDVLRGFDPARLTTVRQNNQGQAGALNEGLRRAAGKYVAFLDHDDLWDEAKLERHVTFMDAHAETGLTFSWSRFVDADGNDMGLHSRHWRGSISYQQLLADFVIGNTSAVVVRRTALDRVGPFSRELDFYYDMDLCLRVAHLGPACCQAIPETLVSYRRHSGQMSKKREATVRDWAKLLVRMRAIAPAETKAIERHANSNMSRYFAWLAYEDGHCADACSFLAEGLRHSPMGFLRERRNWMLGAASVAGLALPSPALRFLEQLAGVRR